MSWNDKNFRMIEMHTESIGSGLVASAALQRKQRKWAAKHMGFSTNTLVRGPKNVGDCPEGASVSCSCQASECGNQVQCSSLGPAKLQSMFSHSFSGSSRG